MQITSAVIDSVSSFVSRMDHSKQNVFEEEELDFENLQNLGSLGGDTTFTSCLTLFHYVCHTLLL